MNLRSMSLNSWKLLPAFAIACATSAVASASPDVAVLSGDPNCIPGHSVTIHTEMEFQDGLWAWRPQGHWDICVNDGGTSQITVNFVDFKTENYQAIITINGHHVDMAPPANRGWAFVFTRQDLMSGEPSAPACEAGFVLDPGRGHRIELDGHFYNQSRNLRLSVEY